MKRIFSLILSVLMIMAIMPVSLAEHAQETTENEKGSVTTKTAINTIDITNVNVTPIIGEKVSEHMAFTIADDAPFTVIEHYWFNDTSAFALNNDNEFKDDGSEYSVGWTLQAKSGYVFDENTKVTINGKTDMLDMTLTCVNSSDSTFFSVWTTPTKAVEKVDEKIVTEIAITDADITPIIGETAGEHLAYSISDEAPFTVIYHGWYNDTTYQDVDDGDTFKDDGSEYSVGWILETKSGYVFEENEKVTINGKTDILDMAYTEIHSDDNTIFYVWTIPTKAVEKVDEKIITEIAITDADITPIIGETAGEHMAFTIADDAPFTVIVHYWFNDTSASKLNNDDEFKDDGSEYSLGWRLEAKSGYVFNESTKVTINGKTDILDMEYTEIDDDNTIFYVWTIPTKAVEKVDEKIITEIAITNADITPIIGETAGEHLAYSIAADVPFTVKEHSWYNETSHFTLSNDAEFKDDGSEYSLCWILEAKSGYVFNESTKVTINGTTDILDMEYTEIDDDNTIFYVWTIPTKAVEKVDEKIITEIAITDADITPIIGETAGKHRAYRIADDAPFTVEFYYWYNDTSSLPLSDDDKFQDDGSEYSVSWTLRAKSGYVFDENAKVTVNGKTDILNMLYTHIQSDNNTTFFVWTLPTKAVEGSAPSYMLGDVNGDEKINTADAVVILKAAAEIITLDDTQLLAADVNHDTKVNTADAVVILKYAASIITELK